MDAQIYNRVLNSVEIYHLWEVRQGFWLGFMPWWQKLLYWAELTWLILIGKNRWRYK